VNVFLRELSAYRRSTIIWAASLSAIIVVFMALYPAFTTDIEATKQILAQLPEALRTALNISLANFFTLYGFYGYLLGFAILAGSIQAMNLGVGVISKEVSGKTADFLLAKPISRSRVVTAKLAAILLMLVATNVVFSAVAYFAAMAVAKDPFAAGTFFLMSSTLLLVQLIFLALGALFAVIIPKVGDVLGSDQVRYVSPFRFYNTDYIITNVRLEGRYLAVEAVVVVVAIALSYVIYMKKDVRSAT
jgi:ABC-2 type transport system permease protein